MEVVIVDAPEAVGSYVADRIESLVRGKEKRGSGIGDRLFTPSGVPGARPTCRGRTGYVQGEGVRAG